MALPDFVNNVRVAAGFLTPVKVIVPGGDPSSADSLSQAINRATLWLTPRVVESFNVNDFIALGDDDKSRLQLAVARFRTVAESVPPTKPATYHQIKQALPDLETIVEILEPYLFDSEGSQVYRALWYVRCHHTDFILGYDFLLTHDPAGDHAVVIWIVVRDDAEFGTKEFRSRLDAIRRDVFQQFEAKKINRYPYLRVRAKSEVWEEVEVDTV